MRAARRAEGAPEACRSGRRACCARCRCAAARAVACCRCPRSRAVPLSRCSDFIFFARSAAEAEALCAHVLADMRGLGWCVNTAKSQLAPSQRVTYLGYELCSAPSPFMQVPAAKIRKCRESIRYLVSRREQFGADVAFRAPLWRASLAFSSPFGTPWAQCP